MILAVRSGRLRAPDGKVERATTGLYFRSVTLAPMLSWSLCKDLGASSREETGK
jgi:hypothetical protein